MNKYLFIAFCALLPCNAFAVLDIELAEMLKPAVVRISTIGTLKDNEPCEKKGTGFFVNDKGFILTAGHNVSPCGGGLGSVGWKPGSRKVQIQIYNGASAINAVVIYEDAQTDLAILRINQPSPNRFSLSAPDKIRVNERLTVMSYAQGLEQPSSQGALIQSLFNPSAAHKGLIDISGVDIHESASGAPLVADDGSVVGVFTKGLGIVGEGVVPIERASVLFQIAGVSYPSNEVREVIRELKKDLYNWNVEYDDADQSVVVRFDKRLKAGEVPISLHVKFDVFVKKRFSDPVYKITYTRDHTVQPGLSKGQTNVLRDIGKNIDERLDAANIDPDDKAYSLVSITAHFVDGTKSTPVVGYRMEFE